jgi:hypothetical protein
MLEFVQYRKREMFEHMSICSLVKQHQHIPIDKNVKGGMYTA